MSKRSKRARTVCVDAFIEEDESKGPVDKETGIKVITEKELKDNIKLYCGRTFVVSYSVKSVADETRKRLIEDIGIEEKNICMGIYDWRNNRGQYFDYFETTSILSRPIRRTTKDAKNSLRRSVNATSTPMALLIQIKRFTLPPKALRHRAS